MAKYTYICNEDGEQEVIRAYKVPSKSPLCIKCGAEMERSLSAPSTVLKGATEANGYYTSPSNAELGLESELTTMKKATKRAEEYLSSEDKDSKLDFERDKQKRQAERSKNIESVKKKMPKFYEKFKQGMERSKKKIKQKKWDKL